MRTGRLGIILAACDLAGAGLTIACLVVSRLHALARG